MMGVQNNPTKYLFLRYIDRGDYKNRDSHTYMIKQSVINGLFRLCIVPQGVSKNTSCKDDIILCHTHRRLDTKYLIGELKSLMKNSVKGCSLRFRRNLLFR